MNTACFCVAADHPATHGHFPGNPIIPGAVLLNATLQAIEVAIDAKLLQCRIKSAKFHRPVRPGDQVAIEYLQSGAEDIRFSGNVDGKTVLTGHLQCSLQLKDL